MKTIVIGSGISGLTAACTLAQAGNQVTVFEQAGEIGGVTAAFQRDGFTWDLGQMLVEGLGPDEPAGQVLAGLGLTEAVQIRKDDRGFVFPDFELRKPARFAGPRWRIDQLGRIFPAEAAGLERYWRDYLGYTRLMTHTRALEYAHGWDKFRHNLGLCAATLPFLPRRDWSARRLIDSYFHDERLKLVFLSILADFSTPPGQFPALGIFALNSEASFDQRSPQRLAAHTQQVFHYSLPGGMRSLVDALTGKITRLGGQILTSRAVTRIQLEHGQVSGVHDSLGLFHPANLVIASGGVNETFLRLVGDASLPPTFAASVRATALTDSVFMLHLGLDIDPSPQLHGTSTCFYNIGDIEGALARLRAGEFHAGRDGFVVQHPGPGMAPPGMHALTIYTICPDTLRDGDWTARKDELASRMLEHAEKRLPGLRAHIRVMHILTPADFRQRTGLAHHAFGGIAPLKDAWKPPHRSPIPGLWFVGAQSESGGGVAAVMLGAFRTALKALELYF